MPDMEMGALMERIREDLNAIDKDITVLRKLNPVKGLLMAWADDGQLFDNVSADGMAQTVDEFSSHIYEALNEYQFILRKALEKLAPEKLHATKGQ